MPKKLIAPLANKKVIKPSIGPGRNTIAQSFLFNRTKAPSTGHASRCTQHQAEFSEYQAQLFWDF